MKLREYLAAIFAIATIYSCGESLPIEHYTNQNNTVVKDVGYKDEEQGDAVIDANYPDEDTNIPCSRCTFVEKPVFFITHQNKNYFLVEGGRDFIELEKNGKAFPFTAKFENGQLFLYSESEITYQNLRGPAKIKVSSLTESDDSFIEIGGTTIPIGLKEDTTKRDLTYVNYRGTAFFAVANTYFGYSAGEILNGNGGVFYVFLGENEDPVSVLISPVIITKKGAYFSIEIYEKDNLITTENFYLQEGWKYQSSYLLDPNDDSSTINIALLATDNLANPQCSPPLFTFKYTDGSGKETIIEKIPLSTNFSAGNTTMQVSRFLRPDGSGNNDELILLRIFKEDGIKTAITNEVILSSKDDVEDPFFVNGNKIARHSIKLSDNGTLFFLGTSTGISCEDLKFIKDLPSKKEISEAIRQLRQIENKNNKRNNVLQKKVFYFYK